MEEPGSCWPESASLEVEGRESLGVLEVDLHPFTTSIGCVPRRKSDQFGSDASPLMVRTHLWIEKKGVVAAVPGHVGEPDEDSISTRGR